MKYTTETPAPDSAAAVQGFYERYWERVRRDPWKEADGSVVRALVGRFEHRVTFCPDGVIVVLDHASADAFFWAETSQGVVDLAKEVFGAPRRWTDLEVDKLVPGRPSHLGFDLDVACRSDADDAAEVPFDRVQVRYVPFGLDPDFWSPDNGERLAERNLKGPAI
jgi:hypothetical protein